MQINIRNCKSSRQLKLNRLSNLRQIHSLQVWHHLPKMAIQIKSTNRPKNKMQLYKNNKKKTMTVVQIGEWESFMTIMTISSTLPSRKSKKLKVAWHPRLVKLKLMKAIKERAKKAKRKWLSNLIQDCKIHSFPKMNLL